VRTGRVPDIDLDALVHGQWLAPKPRTAERISPLQA
jgi:hypothetical protein